MALEATIRDAVISLKGPKDWVLFPEGNHVCNNIPHLYRPLVADWLAAHLSP